MAGQAGLEPATTGFGVRRSSQLELLTPDSPALYLYLAVKGMVAAGRAILLKGKFVSSFLSIFCCRIIFPLTLITGKTYKFAHGSPPAAISAI